MIILTVLITLCLFRNQVGKPLLVKIVKLKFGLMTIFFLSSLTDKNAKSKNKLQAKHRERESIHVCFYISNAAT